MDKIVCAVCGNEENEYGQKYCKECGSELLYIDEDFYFSDLDSQDTEGKKTVSSYDNKCKMTTGTEFSGYKIEEYLTVVSADEVMKAGRNWTGLGLGDMNHVGILDYKSVMSDLKEIRLQLKKELQEQAIDLGGNAIIGVSYSTANLMNAGMLLTITGTAVKIVERRKEN